MKVLPCMSCGDNKPMLRRYCFFWYRVECEVSYMDLPFSCMWGPAKFRAVDAVSGWNDMQKGKRSTYYEPAPMKQTQEGLL